MRAVQAVGPKEWVVANTSRSIVWVDASGKNSVTRLRVAAGIGASTIFTQLLAVSNADYLTYWENLEVNNAGPAPVAAQYQGLQPFTQLQYLCADGSLATLLVPAAKLAIFQADQQSVAPAAVAALTAACVAAGGLVNQSGSPAVSLASGKILPYRGVA